MRTYYNFFPPLLVWAICSSSLLLAQTTTKGSWGAVIPSNVIAASVANLPDGKLLAWSSNARDNFGGGAQTYSTIFDPANNSFTETLVTNTGHNMFCPGIANLGDGRILITGGSSSEKSTIYDPATNSFSNTNNLNTPRGYHSMLTLADGRVFTIGGSWSGGLGNKNAEVWSSNGDWTPYPGITADASVRRGAPDPEGVYRDDNHAWLWLAPNGKIFHAGPGYEMHWFDLGGVGSVQSAGRRGDDQYAMNGNTVMYDIGKILKFGGSTAYGLNATSPTFDSKIPASNTTYTININSGTAQVTRVGNMIQARTLHNAVVLPNGEVVALGGLPTAILFSDLNAIFLTEIWNPTTNQWREVASMSVPRSYHSAAILLQDGRVWVGGGGLCGNCSVNHSDAQIFTPPYLYNSSGALATRPVINTTPTMAAYNSVISVSTSQAISNFSFVRLSSATHSVNNEQRRIPLTFTTNGTNRYRVDIPNANLLPPGNYFLFAMNNAGVPSVAKVIRVSNGQATRQLVANGVYFINSFASATQRVTSVLANNSVRMAGAANNNDQKWEFTHLGDNVYTIKNLGNNKYLEVPYGRCENLAAISTYDIVDADWHRWVISKVGDDYFFRPKHCQSLGLDRNNQDNLGAILYTFSTGNNNQKFRLTSTSDPTTDGTFNVVNGTFEIRSPHTNQNMIAPSWLNYDTRMHDIFNHNDQKWQITHIGNGLHTIKNVASSRFLDVFELGCTDATRVITWTATNGPNQQWYIDKINNLYYFRPEHCPNKALDKITGRDGFPVVFSFSTANVNQQWNLVTTATVAALTQFHSTLEATPQVDRTVSLKWVINQSKEVDQFKLQHTTEDNETFEDISTINPIAKTGIQTYIHYTDVAKIGLNFYRIKIEYADGSMDSTEFRNVFFEEKKADITIFPNPASEELLIDLSNYMTEKVDYLISNTNGQILVNDIFKEDHSKQERISLETFKEGNYILYVRPNKHREVAKQFTVVSH